MLRGMWKNEELGSGTDLWKHWDQRRSGRMSQEDWNEMEGCISRSPGHCMTMEQLPR
jgi:dihydroxyacid dehydratase/phosphogluconate dehydratase